MVNTVPARAKLFNKIFSFVYERRQIMIFFMSNTFQKKPTSEEADEPNECLKMNKPQCAYIKSLAIFLYLSISRAGHG